MQTATRFMVGTFFTSLVQGLRPRARTAPTADWRLVDRIRQEAADLSPLPDTALAQRIDDLKRKVQAGAAATDTSLVLPTFALTVAAVRRVLAIEFYEVQLLAGLALARGAIAEMQTGEGKTLVALLPAVLHALSGEGVHVMTVNRYLAQRDFELLAPVFRLLGLTVGLLDGESDVNRKRAIYGCDVTYGPGFEYGFDYLRDQVTLFSQRRMQLGERTRMQLCGQFPEPPRPIQRGQAIAIVDEADSVMIDEATTPLILAEGGNTPAPNAEVYVAADQCAAELISEQHYIVDKSAGTLQLLPAGSEQLAVRSSVSPPKGLNRPWPSYVEQALRARQLLHRDVHYVIKDGKIVLVDQYTGRLFADRSWRDGLQQAVQAREGVTITVENKSLAHITRQRLFRRYRVLCGMTGTAQGSERELRDIYGVGVVIIPTHRPCQRQNHPVRAFASAAAKEEAIASEVERWHRMGRPVLIGTAAIESSERLARRLEARRIPFQLLNGKQDTDEAAIIARAGERGVVTIATNMAGRGTDIRLGPGVAQLGGLHVIAVEPQESRRVDRQLAGRAARQGDPGSYQLFAAADDALFTRFSPKTARRWQRRADSDGEVRGNVCGEIRAVQRRVERLQTAQRHQLYAQDDWLESVARDLL